MASSGFTTPVSDPSIYVPAINVLEKTVAPDMIAGKLVLIGTSAVGLNDIKTTPVSHAHARRGNPRPGARERVDRRR